MTPVEAHAWLVARWREKLNTARAVDKAEHWILDGNHVFGVDSFDAIVWTDDRSYGAHIAAFDPAFAIAVCEAALRQLARHAPDEWGSGCKVDSAACIGDASWPCVEVLDDAAPFAGRDDFPQELKQS